MKLIYAPSAHGSDAWDASGQVSASQAGKYLALNLLGDFSFRFCEATADVFQKTVGGKKELSKGKNLISMAQNATAIFEIIVRSWEREVTSVIGARDDDSERKREYIGEVHPDGNRIGVDWIKNMSKEISGRIAVMFRNTKDLREKQQFKISAGTELHSVGHDN